MNNRDRIVVQRDVMTGHYALWIVHHRNGKRFVDHVFEQKELPEEDGTWSEPPRPHALIRDVDAQGLMDDLWNVGIRPTGVREVGDQERDRWLEHRGDLRLAVDESRRDMERSDRLTGRILTLVESLTSGGER